MLLRRVNAGVGGRKKKLHKKQPRYRKKKDFYGTFRPHSKFKLKLRVPTLQSPEEEHDVWIEAPRGEETHVVDGAGVVEDVLQVNIEINNYSAVQMYP